MTIEEMLRQEIAAWESLGRPRRQYAALLEHGRAYEIDREASAKIPNGNLGECFTNAALAAIDDDALTYVEGVAYRGLMLVHHAWVINAAGRALEVTWRDGGTECGYCVDGERTVDEDEDGFDEDDEDTWTEPCPHCGATGQGDEHPTLEQAQYYGIAVDRATLVAIIRRNGIYGVLHTKRDLDQITRR